MPRFEVAHLREQGQDMIIVPVNSDFRFKSSDDREAIVADLQYYANDAGLRGTVVVVWDNGGGRMAFIAPEPWHPFFQSMNLRTVAANINRQISW